MDAAVPAGEFHLATNGSAVDVTNKGAMYRAAEALNPIIGELTILPDRE